MLFPSATAEHTTGKWSGTPGFLSAVSRSSRRRCCGPSDVNVSEQVDAHRLVSAARDLIRDNDATTAGLWPRAAALLARQGLELAMARLWEVTAPGLERTSTCRQLRCVGDMLNDRDLGGRN